MRDEETFSLFVWVREINVYACVYMHMKFDLVTTFDATIYCRLLQCYFLLLVIMDIYPGVGILCNAHFVLKTRQDETVGTQLTLKAFYWYMVTIFFHCFLLQTRFRCIALSKLRSLLQTRKIFQSTTMNHWMKTLPRLLSEHLYRCAFNNYNLWRSCARIT